MSIDVGPHEWIDALKWLRAHNFIVLPYAEVEDALWQERSWLGHPLPEPLSVVSEQEWGAIRWNPPEGMRRFQAGRPPPDYPENYEKADPRAHAKPTWDRLLRVIRYLRAQDGTDGAGFVKFSGILDDTVNRLAGAPIPVGDAVAHAGGGVGHFPGLAFIHSNVGDPGKAYRRAVLRHATAGSTINLWTRRDLEGVLERLADNADLHESAKNIHSAKIEAKRLEAKALLQVEQYRGQPLATWVAGIESLEALHAEIRELAESAPTEIPRLAEELRNDTSLPTDIDKAREVLISRLANAANARQNWVLGVVEAQEAHLPAACIEQVNATTAISGIRQRAVNTMSNRFTIADLRAAYDVALNELAAVHVVNTPVWMAEDGSALTLNAAGEYEVAWTYEAGVRSLATLRLQNPASYTGGRLPSEVGDAALTSFGQDVLDPPYQARIWGRTVTQVEATVRVTIQHRGDRQPPADSLIHLNGRNNCGPALLPVRITVT